MATLADLADLGTIQGDGATPLVRARLDSRAVGTGDLFCAIPGFAVDGHDYAAAAVERGAAALLVERSLDLPVPQLVVGHARAATAHASARLAGDPTARLAVVGVTGTNGKTTTTYLVRHLLAATGRGAGLIGTVEQVVGGQRLAGGRTTPEAPDLQDLFAAMVAAGDRACVMEVSSHALELHRADAIHWSAVGFTNLSRDHLDFHGGSMAQYFAAKRRLLDAAPDRAVIDVDDAHGRQLAADLPAALTVGRAADASLRADDLAGDASGTSFTVAGQRTRVPLPGAFNVSNALMALGLVQRCGVPLAEACAALPHAPPVPGRMQPVGSGRPFAVFVDYAHTPDALERLLAAARVLTDRRVLCVFGCGGDRDRGKRPEMGRAAEQGADLAVLTSDNPRGEDPERIAADVLAGMSTAPVVELDRRLAIRAALAAAAEGDIVVIAGKGHEQGQQIGTELLPFDDAQVAAEELGVVGAR